jgi:methylated-DNA-protein-cysteine methyltransferase-like protein
LKKLPRAKRPKRAAPSSAYTRIYAVVCRIPRGRVATYGQIAELAGLPGHARQVGYAMHALPDGSSVPWHRVISASGGISLGAFTWGGLQRALLESEGVKFDRAGRVSLERFRWSPRGRPTPAGRRASRPRA